jgi:hypothetical protein
MRRLSLSAVLILILVSLIAATAWSATASFTPPGRDGDIFAVINFARSGGATQPTSVTVDWGPFHRTETVGRRYGNCERATPAGIVLLIRHFKPDSNLFTLSTNGTIVRGPYQGEVPPEISHACYKLLKMRARY